MGTFMTSSTPATAVTIESAVEQGKRAYALGKYEQAVQHYSTALEIATKKYGDEAPETADLYFSYGKALLENAISQNSVLGKEQTEEAIAEEKVQASGSGSGSKGPILSFSGDAEEDGEEQTVDLFGQAAAAQDDDDDEEEEEHEGGDDDEPEDDFNMAWEMLELARGMYDKQKNEGSDDEVKLKLADTYIALGDVSLETEKFDQAIADFESGLALKTELLPVSSRQIAEAHYKLSMVLDLTSGRLSDAITHVKKALESVDARIAELRKGLAGELPPLPAQEQAPTADAKGKGKAVGARLIRDDYVQNMTKTQIENEIKELSGLREDLALKVEELKTSPNEAIATNAPAMAAQALDELLGMGPGSVASASSTSKPAVVNDLTSIVKKKKKVAPAPAEESTTSGKRKADDDAESLNAEKKVKLDTPEAA